MITYIKQVAIPLLTTFVITILSLNASADLITYTNTPAAAGQIDGSQSTSTTSYRIGTGGTAGSIQYAGIFLYEVPLGATEITNATLAQRILIDSGTPTFNVDLYGIGYVRSTDPADWDSIYYSGLEDSSTGLNIGTNSVTKIQDQFNAAGTQGNRVTSSSELLDFLNLTAEYINADENVTAENPAYLVFRLSADVDLSALGTTERYRHIPDNAATYLSFDYNVIPEPATLSLLGAGVLILLGVRRKFTC